MTDYAKKADTKNVQPITLELLKRADICRDARNWFAETFPQGWVIPTEPIARRISNTPFDWVDAAEFLLRGEWLDQFHLNDPSEPDDPEDNPDRPPDQDVTKAERTAHDKAVAKARQERAVLFVRLWRQQCMNLRPDAKKPS